MAVAGRIALFLSSEHPPRPGDVANVAATEFDCRARNGKSTSAPTGAFARECAHARCVPDVQLRETGRRRSDGCAVGILSMFFAEVGGEDDVASLLLHLLKEIGDFEVGVTIVASLTRRVCRRGIGFVEEDDGVAGLGGAKNGAEVFLGLPDLLADHVREDRSGTGPNQFAGEHLSRHLLPCAARPAKSTSRLGESQPAPEAQSSCTRVRCFTRDKSRAVVVGHEPAAQVPPS